MLTISKLGTTAVCKNKLMANSIFSNAQTQPLDPFLFCPPSIPSSNFHPGVNTLQSYKAIRHLVLARASRTVSVLNWAGYSGAALDVERTADCLDFKDVEGSVSQSDVA